MKEQQELLLVKYNMFSNKNILTINKTNIVPKYCDKKIKWLEVKANIKMQLLMINYI